MCQNSHKIFPIYVRVNDCEYKASRYTPPQFCCMLLSPISHFLIIALQYYPFCLAGKKKTHKYSSSALIFKKLQSLLLRKQQKNVTLGSVKIKAATDSLQHQCQACEQRLWVSTNRKLQQTSHQPPKGVHTLAPGFRYKIKFEIQGSILKQLL